MVSLRPCSWSDIAAWRAALFAESGGQSVHDSLPRRQGWTACFAFTCAGLPAGYGAVAIAGLSQGRPTLFEFYLASEFQHHAFALFECFLTSTQARHCEVQTSHRLPGRNAPL